MISDIGMLALLAIAGIVLVAFAALCGRLMR